MAADQEAGMKRLISVVLVVALATLGCGSSGGKKAAATDSSDRSDSVSSDSDAGSDSDSDSATDSVSSDGRSAQQLEADRKIAQGALLKLSDLPEGFTAKPRSSSSHDSAEEKAITEKFASCLGVDPSLVVNEDDDDTKATAKSDKFSKDPSLDFDMRASVGASSEDQEKVFEAFGAKKASACFETFFNDALTFNLEHPDPGETAPQGLTLGDAFVETHDLAVEGKTVTYRVTIPFTIQGQTAEVVSDFVLALKGRIGMTLTFQNVGGPFPEDLEVQITQEAIDGAPDS
jgi:hypothetical protein